MGPDIISTLSQRLQQALDGHLGLLALVIVLLVLFAWWAAQTLGEQYLQKLSGRMRTAVIVLAIVTIVAGTTFLFSFVPQTLLDKDPLRSPPEPTPDVQPPPPPSDSGPSAPAPTQPPAPPPTPAPTPAASPEVPALDASDLLIVEHIRGGAISFEGTVRTDQGRPLGDYVEEGALLQIVTPTPARRASDASRAVASPGRYRVVGISEAGSGGTTEMKVIVRIRRIG